MQNADINLIDIKLTCYFEIRDAKVFGGTGSIGYTYMALGHVEANNRFADVISNSDQRDGFLYAQRKSVADFLGVPVECVRSITYNQYAAATEDDETEGEDDEDY